MRLLLTGGAGYVGSACLRWLLKHGHNSIAFDNLTDGNAQAVPAERLVVGDISDRFHIVRVLKEHRIEAVLHFAALVSVPESIAQAERYWNVNFQGTKNVLDAMLEAGVKKLLFSSTAATYSFSAPMPLTEESEQKPQVPYGTTKLAGEWVIRDYARAYGIQYGILRYFNASGADADGRHGESRRAESHLIPLILHAAQGRIAKLSIFGGDWPTRDGTCVRDFVHVEDLASAHQLALEQLPAEGGLVFNVGTGNGTTVLEAFRAAEKIVGRPIPHEIFPRRPGDPSTLVASPAKIMSALGWKPRYTSIDDIVASAWRWHSRHPNGYGGM